MKVVSGDNFSYKTFKAPVKSSPPTNQHPFVLHAGCSSCHPANGVKALKENRKKTTPPNFTKFDRTAAARGLWKNPLDSDVNPDH